MKGRGCLLVVLLTIDCDRANIHLIVEVVIPVELVDEISKNHGLKTAREDLSPDEKALGLVKVHPNQKLSRIENLPVEDEEQAGYTDHGNVVRGYISDDADSSGQYDLGDEG